MNLNRIRTGRKVLIQIDLGGVWMEGSIAKTKGVDDKYVSLLNGEEALARQVRNLRFLK